MDDTFKNQKYIVSDAFYNLFLENGQLVNGKTTENSRYEDDYNTFNDIFNVAVKYLTDNKLIDIHEKICLDDYLASIFKMPVESLITLDEYERLIYMLIRPVSISYMYTKGQQKCLYNCYSGQYIPYVYKKPVSIRKESVYKISDKMLEYLNEPAGTKMSRCKLMSKLCSQIKKNNLSDGKYIVPDEELSNLLGCKKEKILMISISKYLCNHIIKI